MDVQRADVVTVGLQWVSFIYPLDDTLTGNHHGHVYFSSKPRIFLVKSLSIDPIYN